ncbi:MAG: SpoVG family protein [Oscillospiraceae bacterium]|jgi:stage V sporulation protein G|nr:SpoVG family protein [Oscillospiraceae bacterium]
MQNETTYQAPQLPVEYDIRIYSLNASGTRRATASVNINGQFAIRGIKIMSSQNGLFVSMPSYKTSDNKYKDIAFPCTKESKAEFDRAVLSAYQQELANLQTQGQDMANGDYSGYSGANDGYYNAPPNGYYNGAPQSGYNGMSM